MFLQVNLGPGRGTQVPDRLCQEEYESQAFFDLLLPMRGTLPVGSRGFVDKVFGSLIDWLWFSAGLFSVQDILFVSLNRVMRWYTRCRVA
jgi:hypothetical protein